MKTIFYASLILLALSSCFIATVFSDEKAEAKVNYKYKKYERFDLGNLEVQGNVIAPGDLSVKERERRTFNRSLFSRGNFDDESRKDVLDLR